LPGSLPPTQAGADGMLNKIIFSGTHDAFSFTSDYDGSHYGGYNTIYSIGSKVSGISKVLNSIIPTTIIEQATFNPFGPVKYVYDGYLDSRLYFGGMYYNTLSSDSRYAIFSTGDSVYTNIGYNLVGCWKSQLFRIGRPFKVTKVKIGVEFGWGIIISVDCDPEFYGKNKSYKAKDITYSDFVSTHSTITQQFENATGWSSFNLSIYFYKTTSSDVPTGRIALPIIIEYELLDD
jgi:hypothetical protein